MLNRWDIINLLIEKYHYQSYLEIGTYADECLAKVNCANKVGVDPAPIQHNEKNSGSFYLMSSDEYFHLHNAYELSGYDIIFIDGLHEREQVRRDILNSLDVLNESGTIIVHDCLPVKEEEQHYPNVHNCYSWNGNVWKGFLDTRQEITGIKSWVVDTDWGCGIIQRGKSIFIPSFYAQSHIQSIVPNEIMIFENFQKYKKEWMNIITIEEFYKIFDIKTNDK
jgi:hypothetical protein